MKNEPANHPQAALIVWWMIWAALLIGVFVIYFGAGKDTKPSPGTASDSLVWMVCFVPFLISVAVRWLVIPRIKAAQAAMPFFLVGLVAAESICLLGLFAFPAHKIELFALGVAGLLQMAPFFANRFTELGQNE
jgi:cytochrome bd-type quinol oxidase subunit 2